MPAGSRGAPVVLFLLLSLGGTAGVFAQTARGTGVSATASPTANPRIVLSLLDAPKGDTQAETIAATVTQSMGLMLRLTGRFAVEKANFLDPVASYDRSVLYYRKVEAKLGIFGTVKPDSTGGFAITVELWRPTGTTRAPKTFSKTITNVFSVFDASDQLALQVASEAVGKSLSVGSLQIKNQANLANYGVYVDGQLLGRSLSTVKVLTGKRTVIVAVPGPLGDQPVQTFHVDIAGGKPATITLTKNPEVAKSAQKSSQSSPKPTSAPEATPKPTGGLTVTTTPAGATVKLDQKVIGTTPLHLFGVPVGTYRLTIGHKLFKDVETVAQIRDHGDEKVNVKLEVNQKDPEIAHRMITQRSAAVGSALWSGLQAANILGSTIISSDPHSTTDFWSQEAGAGFQSPVGAASVALNSMLLRIGHRIAVDPVQAAILDGISGLGALLSYNVVIPQSLGAAPSTLSGVLSTVGEILLAGTVVYDVASSPFAVTRANNRTLAYVQVHGTLPPLHTDHAHHIIVETGGDSLVRGGYSYSLIPDYLSVAGTLGAGLSSSGTAAIPVDLSGALRLSYNPFGTSTGRIRPELNVGLRATTDFSSVNVSVDLGTGNDWVGRSFDIFTRGGASYNITAKHFSEYLTIGTRLF